MFHIFLNWSGSSNPSGNQYGFFSGFGSDLGEVAIIGAVGATYKHHNCAVPRCWRIAHHKYEIKETKQYTCRMHHTQFWHDLLIKQYKQDYPQQHKLINKKQSWK
jgi:hypothetical protein